MPTRRPTKAELNRVIAIDLLADWRPYAEPPRAPKGPHDWRYLGVVTIDGVPGALAWRAGGFGVGTGGDVRELGLWDRIKLNRLLETLPPGIERAPRFPPAEMRRTQLATRPGFGRGASRVGV